MFKVVEYSQDMVLEAISEHFKRHHARGLVKPGEVFESVPSETDHTEYVVVIGDPSSDRWLKYGESEKGGW